MNLTAVKMDRRKAEEILRWEYEVPYDFYNNEFNDEELSELLNGKHHHRCVLRNRKLKEYAFEKMN